MLKFHKPVITDNEWVRECVEKSGYMGCEYSFTNIYVWHPTYKTQIAHYDNFFMSRSINEEFVRYCVPAGEGSLLDPIKIILEDAKQFDKPLAIYGITDETIPILEKLFPNQFKYIEIRDSFDYIYSSENLINLKGKKFHSKRNHISNFNRKYDWLYEDITADNIDECKAMFEQWIELDRNKDKTDINHEVCALNIALENYDALELFGGLIRIDGKPVAFTIADKINDNVVDVHFEKAFADVQGCYTAINNEFAKQRLSSFKYVNREEDLGIEGLRKAKLSYYPDILYKKYIAVPL